MNIKNSLCILALIIQLAPCHAMNVEPTKQPIAQTSPLLQMPPEVLEHILTFVIENDPDALGNLAKIQEVCKKLAGFLSKDEMKWLLMLDERELYYQLGWAVSELNAKKIQLLVNLGALSNDKYKNGILLRAAFYAAHSKQADYYQKLLQIISILEKAGATWKENEYNTQEATLEYAIMLKKTPIVQLLLEHGIKPVERHLKNAIDKQNIEIAALLLKHGLMPTRDQVNMAISLKAPEFLKLLITYGADVISQTEHGESIFEFTEDPEIGRILLNAGAMPNAATVCLAVERNNIKLLKLFIEHGADVNAIDGYHFTMPPLAYATTSQVAKILLEAGAQLFIDCQRTTPLKELAKTAIASKDPMILVEVLKTRYRYQTAVAIATAILAGAPYISAVCTIL